ncbi:hypothetical protein ACJ41O_001747 [Fusarium nematophilum]
MDPLCGIDGSRPSPPRNGTVARRDSSISLEDGVVQGERYLFSEQHIVGILTCASRLPPQMRPPKGKSTYDPSKPPLPLLRPHEPQSPTKSRGVSPEDGCLLLSSEPNLSSSPPSAFSPMQAYLQREESHEKRAVNLGDAPLTDAADRPRDMDPKPPSSSWVLLDKDRDADSLPAPKDTAEKPCTPELHPVTPPVIVGDLEPASDGRRLESPDSGISDLSLSGGHHPPLGQHLLGLGLIEIDPDGRGEEDEVTLRRPRYASVPSCFMRTHD